MNNLITEYHQFNKGKNIRRQIPEKKYLILDQNNYILITEKELKQKSGIWRVKKINDTSKIPTIDLSNPESKIKLHKNYQYSGMSFRAYKGTNKLYAIIDSMDNPSLSNYSLVVYGDTLDELQENILDTINLNR